MVPGSLLAGPPEPTTAGCPKTHSFGFSEGVGTSKWSVKFGPTKARYVGALLPTGGCWAAAPAVDRTRQAIVVRAFQYADDPVGATGMMVKDYRGRSGERAIRKFDAPIVSPNGI